MPKTNNNFWNNFNKEHLVAAHRGDRSKAPENTMIAFEQSIGKCDFVEFDVGFSKDGVAVILHDDTLPRTSNAKELSNFSHPYRLVDYDYSNLLELDMGGWFKNKSIENQCIPTLRDSLLFFKAHNMPVNVEIKDLKGTKYDESAPKKVLDLILDADMLSLSIVSSFNHSYIKKIKLLCPDISTAALVEDAHPDNLLEYLTSLGVSAYHIDKKLIDKKLISKLKSHGIYTNAYTINSQKEKKEAFDKGIKAIFTDYLEDMPAQKVSTVKIYSY